MSFSIQRGTRQRRTASLTIVMLFACAVGTARAAADNAFSAPDAFTDLVPPTSIDAIDEYLPDAAFNQGRMILDHFGGPNSADQVGLLSAPLSNGDIVVAGLVPAFGASGTCSNGTALCYVGLVRYSPSGVRVAWSNPDGYGHAGNQYIIYGGSAGAAPAYQYLRDLRVTSGRIYVMVDTGLGSGGTKDVRVLRFSESGSPSGGGISGVFGFGTTQDVEDFYGAQMAIVGTNRMMVAATGYDSIGPFVAVNRLQIAADGSLSQDLSWGQPYGGATRNQVVRYYGPGGYCGQARCEVIATAAQPANPSTDFYVGASIHIVGDDWDPIAIKISSDTGALKPEFNGSGWSRAIFNEPSSTKRDTLVGLQVLGNVVTIGARVARKCFDGIGLSQLDGATGQYATAFGIGGKVVFGGQGDAPLCISPPYGDYPTAIARTTGRIAVVGYGRRGTLGTSNHIDPLLAVVDSSSGVVLDIDTHPVLDATGNRLGDAVLYGVFAGTSSAVVVSGAGRTQGAGNSLSYLTGRFTPSSSDRIFASGFE